MANQFAKTVDVSAPYATFAVGDWQWNVIKTYQMPVNERKNDFARWMVAARSPNTFGSWELGDTYIASLFSIEGLRLTYASDAWVDAYDLVDTLERPTADIDVGKAHGFEAGLEDPLWEIFG